MTPTPREYRRDRGGVDVVTILVVILLVVVILAVAGR